MVNETNTASQLTKLILEELNDGANFILKAELSNFYSKEELYELVYTVVENNFGITNVKSLLQNEERKRNQKKKRWANNTLDNYDKYIVDGEEAISGLKANLELVNKHKSITENKLSLIRNKETTVGEFDSYFANKIESSINEINNWLNNKKANLCEFIFFPDKTSREQKVSLEADLYIFIFNYLEHGSFLINIGTNKSNDANIRITESFVNPFIEKANSAITHSIMRPSRSREEIDEQPIDAIIIDGDGESSNSSMKVYISKLIDDDDVERGLFFKEDHVKNAQNKKLEGLTPTDDRIFHMGIMQLRDQTFMQSREIKFTETELLKALYPSRKKFTSKEYDRLRDSIFKLLNVGIYRKEEKFSPESNVHEGTYHTFYRYISEMTVEKSLDKSEPDRYTVIVSKTLYDDYFNQQITRIYGEYTKIISDLSWAISFPLQQQRIALATMYLNNPETPLQITLDFRFFDNIYKFSCYKKKAIDKILDSLREMRDATFLIQKFSYIKGRFNITFLPISKEELKDINDNIVPNHVLNQLQEKLNLEE